MKEVAAVDVSLTEEVIVVVVVVSSSSSFAALGLGES